MRMMKYTMYFFGVFFAGTTGLLIVEWGAPILDEQGNPIPDEYSNEPVWKAYVLRFWKEVVFYDKMIKEPSRLKLLPDPLTEPYYQPPYTLVLEMTGVLVHPDWTYKTGWRFKKRPGVDFFLQQVAPPLFEVVIYTSEQGFTAMPILESLDPNGYIMYKLYRDATRYTKGQHIKDLDCLNRDLSKVILVDWNNNAFQLHPQNALKLRKWKGEDGDRTLIDLAIFLRTIATSNVEDVRLVLEHYGQFDDPLEAFKENQRRLEEEQSRLPEKLSGEDKPGIRASGWMPSLLRRKSY
jgi:import inner membrane translocase subunit TIM50